jgi:hypothetical protein
MRKWVAIAFAATACAFALLAAAPPASAASATGCRGAATSRHDNGSTLDRASAPGSGGTSDHPFQVEYDGTVRYRATFDNSLDGGTWKVQSSVFSFSGDINTASTTQSGTEKVSDHIPFVVPGLYKVKITAEASGKQSCTIDGWIKIIDSPVGTPLWFAGIGLVVFAVPFFLFARPSAP